MDNSILKKFVSSLPKALTDSIKQLHVKFNAETPATATPAVPAPAPVKMDKQMKTQDGTKTISIAGDMPAIGVAVMDITTGTPIALADGTYTLEDGSVIVVASGMISTYTPGTPTEPPMDMTKMSIQFAAQKTEFAALVDVKFKVLNDKNTELEKRINDMTALNKVLIEFANAFTESPVPDKPVVSEVKFSKELSEEEYKKLNNADKVRYNKIWK